MSFQQKRLAQQLAKPHQGSHPFKYPKLLHLYWDGSPLSYLNYLTLISFNEHNPNWKINIYTPIQRTKINSWKSLEQSLRYEGECYFHKLSEMTNVVIHKVCLEEMGFYNDASEVIKSDYLRFYILSKHGGVWSDFDILYTGSIEKKMNFPEDAVIFRTPSGHQPPQPSYHYPIGLFLATPNNKFFKFVVSQCKKYYNKNEYQSIGANMFSKLFPSDTEILAIGDSVKICDKEYYLPWNWNEVDDLVGQKKSSYPSLPINNVGVHWYNGGDQPKQYAIDLGERTKKPFQILCHLDQLISKYCDYNVVCANFLNEKVYTESEIVKIFGINILSDFITHNNFHKITTLSGNDQSYDVESYKNVPKIFFTEWGAGSAFTFMHYLTLYTIKKHHPDYKIILYLNNEKINKKPWSGQENWIDIEKNDYLSSVFDLDIEVRNISFLESSTIPFYLPEITKSDIFRIECICKHGGIWFDLDTFWVNKINFDEVDKFRYQETLDCIADYDGHSIATRRADRKTQYPQEVVANDRHENEYLVLCKKLQDNHKKMFPHFCQYILAGNKNSDVYKMLLEASLSHINLNDYQSVGTSMFNKLLPPYFTDKIKNGESVGGHFLNLNKFSPYRWHETNKLFNGCGGDAITLTKDSSCVHWFNGSVASKEFSKNFTHSNFGSYSDTNFLKIFNSVLDSEDKSSLQNLKKVSIVMAYYNRKEQLIQTLKSIMASAYKNIEIIIVDDNSRLDQRVSSFIDDISGHLDIRVITISEEQKTWTNPCMAFNIGLRQASGDIIMMQSPEVLHVGDCIQHAVENLRLGDWLSYNCYGSPSFDYNKRLHQKTDSELFEIVDTSPRRLGGCSVQRDDVGGWLNHYDNHFVAYHYCAAIHKKDLLDVMGGGFNEAFKNSIGSDDDEFIKRLIYNKFNFKISEFSKTEPFVIHQFHEKPSQLRNVDYKTTQHIFDNACRELNFEPQNNIALAPKNEIPMSRRVVI